MKLRSLVSSLAICMTLLLASVAFGNVNPNTLAYPVNNYQNWRGYVVNGNSATGAQTITLAIQGIGTGSSINFNPLVGYGQVPVLVDQDAVTPTAISCTLVPPAGVNLGYGDQYCTMTATFGAIHGNGSPISTNDQGVQEAINDACLRGGEVILDGSSGVLTSSITGATLCGSVTIEDRRASAPPTFWYLRPSATTLIGAGAAPTNVNVTGSMTSGAYYTSYLLVDCLGGVSLAATDSSQTTSSTGITETIPTSAATATGACGWLPYVTAASGATGTEIAVPVTTAVCTISTLETNITACSLSSAATILANPSSTSKEPLFGTAYSTMSPAAFSDPPEPFKTVYPPFTTVTTISSGSNSDVAEIYIPAGYFNYLTKSINVCFEAVGTLVSTAVPTWSLQVSNNLLQSPATIDAIALPTATGATAWYGCFKVQTAVTGATGKFWGGGQVTETQGTTTLSTATTIATTALPASGQPNLTNGVWFELNLAAATANITGVTVNSLWLEPITAN
jgi:hypothetical protein